MTTANRVWETSTTTGTGNLTLAGAVSNYVTFTSQYVTNERFTYWIDNKSGLWETGAGYLSGTTTLVRETVKDNSSETTSAINFTGTLQVFLSNSENSFLWYPPFPNAGTDGTLRSVHYVGGGSSTRAAAADVMYLSALVIPREVTLTHVGVEVTTAQASSLVRLGLAMQSADGTYTVIDDFGTVDTSTTGSKEIATTRKLKKGVYFQLVVSDTLNVTMRGLDTDSYMLDMHLGYSFHTKFRFLQKTDATAVSSGFAASYSSWSGITNAIFPVLYYRI